MKKKSCILVGYGYWGKKIYPSLISHFNVKKIFRSSDRMQDIFFENIDWAFIITPEKTHYNLVSFTCRALGSGDQDRIDNMDNAV